MVSFSFRILRLNLTCTSHHSPQMLLFFIELGDGHYFIRDPGLIIEKQLRFVGDEHEPAHVVVELSGEITWKANGGWMEGITIRRPRIATGVTPNKDMLTIDSCGRLNMYNCVFDNRGSIGNCISVGSGATGSEWGKTTISGGSRENSGLLVGKNAQVELDEVSDSSKGFGQANDFVSFALVLIMSFF